MRPWVQIPPSRPAVPRFPYETSCLGSWFLFVIGFQPILCLHGVDSFQFRYRWADIFWSNLFHEIGHILLHSRNTVILEGVGGTVERDRQEAQADQCAADTLPCSADILRTIRPAGTVPSRGHQAICGATGPLAGRCCWEAAKGWIP